MTVLVKRYATNTATAVATIADIAAVRFVGELVCADTGGTEIVTADGIVYPDIVTTDDGFDFVYEDVP